MCLLLNLIMVAIECPVLPGYFFTRDGMFSVGTADGPFFKGSASKIGLKIYRRIYHEERSLFVHRLVAFTHCPNPLPTVFVVVDHINGLTEDNRAENLRWVTQQLNITNSSARNAFPVVNRPLRKNGRWIFVKRRPNESKLWKSKVTIEGQTNYLGNYPTEEEACQSSRSFRRKKFEEIYKRILKEHAVEGEDAPSFDLQPLRPPRSPPRPVFPHPAIQRACKA